MPVFLFHRRKAVPLPRSFALLTTGTVICCLSNLFALFCPQEKPLLRFGTVDCKRMGREISAHSVCLRNTVVTV